LPESFETYQIVHPGDIVFRLTDLQNDKRSLRTAIVDERGIITSAYLALEPLRANPKFFNYLFRAYDLRKVFYAMGGGVRQSMKYEDVKRLEILLPPVDEQEAIVDFLDRETEKIDALIEEQRRLIALLKEKRQTVISRVVSTGLDPSAPMKCSGNGWIGDVPQHWTFNRIKRIARIISKGTTPTTIGAEFTDSGVRFLKAENITTDGVSLEPEFFIDEEAHHLLARSALAEGDVLVVIAGATTGKSSVVDPSCLPANTNQAVSFIRLVDTAYSRFLSYWLSTDSIQKMVLLGSVQSAQPNLSMEDLGNLPVVLPPLQDLQRVMKFLDEYSKQNRRLLSSADRLIALLQERRSALISAAVTGKIDIRGLAANTAEVPEAAYESA
jgi:type I restriction enzyme S subunit